MKIYRCIKKFLCAPLEREILIGTILYKWENTTKLALSCPIKGTLEYSTPEKTNWIYEIGLTEFITLINNLPEDDVGRNVNGNQNGDEIILISNHNELAVETNHLNFMGTQVTVKRDNDEPAKAHIWIPSPEYVSHYNSSDGANSAVVTDPVGIIRHVSSPTTEGNPFFLGDWSGDSLHPCFKTSTIQEFTTSDTCSFMDTTTTIEVNVYSTNGVLLATHSSSMITGNVTTTQNNIQISVVNWDADSDKYKANIYITLGIVNVIPAGGRFSVKITHHNSSEGDFTFQSIETFLDIETTTQSINGITITENTLTSTKYLSGIRYYDLGDTFNIEINNLDWLNTESYPTDFIEITSWDYYGINNFNLEGNDLDSWNSLHTNVNATYNREHTISRTNFRYIGTVARITGQVIDWAPGMSSNSADSTICIDTWAQQSNELAEYFTDEMFRRTSTDIVWNSIQDLTSYDDNKALMIQEGKLKTMRGDWNNYAPGNVNNPDYTNFSGSGTYYRRFTDVNSAVHGSCVMTITGFTLQNLIDEDIKIWIMIPGRFTSPCYLHGISEYDFGTFTGDNDPIRTGDSSTSIIYMSFGALGLDATHNYFIMHLETANPGIEPSSIVINF